MTLPIPVDPRLMGEDKMTKGYKSSNLAKVEKMISSKNPEEFNEENFRGYKNSKGIDVILVPIAPYLIELASSTIEIPEAPTYTVETIDGGIEIFHHDQTSVDQSDDETKKKWFEYQAAVKEADRKASEILMNIIMVEGIKLDSIPDEERWIKRQKLMGIPIPDDYEEKLLMYKKTQILASPEDIENVTRIVIELTMVSKEEVASAKKTFQGNVESEASEGAGNTIKRSS